jgi:hypothetical protein
MSFSKLFTGLIVACLMASSAAPPVRAQDSTNKEELRLLSEQFSRYVDEHRPPLYYDMLRSSDPAQAALNRDKNIQLIYIDDNGMPVYYGVHNLIAAKTISTDRVWPGGGAGYSLTGSGTASNQFALWDAGGVLLTHQEFGGRVINADGHSGSHPHSTLVAGTLVAAGVVANAKGMSYQANLGSYDWSYDNSEMVTAASNGLLVSNHSYGRVTGWEWNSDQSVWYWYGTVSISTTEDYGFGFYDSAARQWDSIAYNAPHYLIVKSAGNDRTDDGPGPGGGHYYWSGGSWTWSTATRDPDGGADGYDCIGYKGNAKNIMTVGAVDDIPLGYTQPSDVVQAAFSSWGPTDDGRIKPDIVGNGVGVYSCTNTSNTAYTSASGTSLSSPNIAGSINLLIRHFETEQSYTPRSATMKAIVIQTADEAGDYDGPDYQNGWGLMNTESAADLIAASPSQIIEDNLANGSTDQHYFTLANPADLRATIVWTDPPGTVPPLSLNPTTPILVNDLDLRLQHVPTGTTYYPWRLDGTNPAAAATKGDNSIDNVEVVDVSCAPAGQYVATISHKGSIGAGQNYSFCWSTGPVIDPCIVSPTNFDFGSIEAYSTRDTTFTISATACDTLRGTVSVPGPDYSIVSGGGSYELLPGEERVVTVRFQPQSTGLHYTFVETGDGACSDVFVTGYALEAPPACFVDADTLRFGMVEVGKDSSLSFTITNIGGQTLTGTISETCTDFAVTAGLGSFSLTHGQVHSVTVTFFPSIAGEQLCPIKDGTTLCLNVRCVGTGVESPVCSVDPPSVDFGTVLVGGTKDTTITISNTGGGTLDGTVSESCDHYSIVSGEGAYSLTTGQSHAVTLRFEPASTGTHPCTLATGQALCGDVSCTGVGEILPVCVVDPDTLRFGTVVLDDSLSLQFSITNTGGGTLSGSVSEACGQYSIVSGGGPYALANGDTVHVVVKFKPTAAGNDTCSLSLGAAECGDLPCIGTGDDLTGIETNEPPSFRLFQNYPNPFQTGTNIRYSLDREGIVVLRIYDIAGRHVRTLINRGMAPGTYTEEWDGRDGAGHKVASGIYFYQLKMGTRIVTRKAVLLN